MPLAINETAPDFTADSTEGKLHFYDWAGDNWVLFFSHPKDFTPVCTTELGAVAKLKPEFDKRGVKVLGLSVDPVDNHTKWAADIAESHTNYPMLIRFRSPRPLQSWLIALLAVMDSAALLLALCPSRDRIEPRFCLRMGFSALREIATTVGIPVDDDPDPDGQIQLSYQDYLAGVTKLVDVGFPVERGAEEAWPHFRGWRVNYESTVYALAAATDAVPALWSGPRRSPAEQIPPVRPKARRPTEYKPGQERA